MDIRTDKVHQDVHTVTVEQDEALRMVAERVAAQLGMSLDAIGVSYRAYVSTRDTSTGFHQDVFVEIKDDHRLKAQVVAMDLGKTRGPLGDLVR